jgi:hypothetical protein
LRRAQTQKLFLVIIAVQAAFTLRLGHQSLSNNQEAPSLDMVEWLTA